MNELKFWLLKYNSGIHGSREVRIFSHLSGRWTQAVGSWCPRHSQGLLSWITQCIKKPQNWKENPTTVAAWLGLTMCMDYAECESLHIELNPCQSVTSLCGLNLVSSVFIWEIVIDALLSEVGGGWTEKLPWETWRDLIGQLSEVHVSESKVLVFYLLRVKMDKQCRCTVIPHFPLYLSVLF